MRFKPQGALLLLSLAVGTAWAADSAGGSEFGPVLFGHAILVVGAKMGGLVAARWGQPSVLGELLVGIVIANLFPLIAGGTGIEFVRSNSTLRFLAEVGVLLLLFDVGLETDLRALARVGVSAVLVALIGVVVPFFLGWGAGVWFLPDASKWVHIFLGATLTATGVGITVRVLKDLRVTETREGQTIIGAAILDDILGLIVLAIVVGSTTAAGPEGNTLSLLGIAAILLKAVVFLGLAIGLGHWLSDRIVRLAARTGQEDFL